MLKKNSKIKLEIGDAMKNLQNIIFAFFIFVVVSTAGSLYAQITEYTDEDFETVIDKVAELESLVQANTEAIEWLKANILTVGYAVDIFPIDITTESGRKLAETIGERTDGKPFTMQAVFEGLTYTEALLAVEAGSDQVGEELFEQAVELLDARAAVMKEEAKQERLANALANFGR